MGKLNEIQEQMTQSYGDNAFTTTIKDNTVEFDSLKDKFTFADEVEVPSLKVNGESVNSQVQSDWNQSDSEAVDFIKNKPTIPSAQIQSDWNQNDSEAVDFIKNKPTIPSAQVQADWNQNDDTQPDYIKNHPNIKKGTGTDSIIEGNINVNIASGGQSHAEGSNTQATGLFASHAEGYYTQATGSYAHSEGNSTKAEGSQSHAEGFGTQATGISSHTEGEGTQATGTNSHVGGMYNTPDTDITAPAWTSGTYHKGDKVIRNGKLYICKVDTSSSSWVNSQWALMQGLQHYAEIIGNGLDNSNRSNARTLDWDGNEMLAGTLTLGGASGATIKVDSGALKVSFDGGTTWLTISAS